MICDRCSVEMTLGPMYEGSTLHAWYCSCCRSRLRTPEIRAAENAERAAAEGISVPEFVRRMHERAKELVRTEPPDGAEWAHILKDVERRSSEWQPACEHDTDNPWLPSSSASAETGES